MPLVKAVQQLSAQNDNLKVKNEELEARLSKLELLLVGKSETLDRSVAYIKQNIPNPALNNTTISYYTPSNGQIRITDIKGGLIKTYTLNKGVGQLSINSKEMATGTYIYTLFVDGKSIETKKMIVSR